MIEVWRNVVGYEGYYEVSNWGRIKSLNYNKTGQEQLMTPTRNRDGYLQVLLWKDGKRKNLKVHRLVAQAFVPNPQNLPEVNHRDENKENNHVENLEWITAKKNCNYRTRNERIAKTLTNGKRSKPVYQRTFDGEFVREYLSVHEVTRQTGWSQSLISKCCRGEINSAYGFKWSYNKQ